MHDDNDLTNRIWKLAQGGDDAEMRQHIETCESCQHELAVLQRLSVFRQTTGGQLQDPPNHLVRTLSGLFERVRPDLLKGREIQPTLTERLRTVWAELLQDTGLQVQVVGLRGGESQTRQIAFVSDIADLDLEITRADDRFLIVGQLGMDELPDDLHIRFLPFDGDSLSGHDTNTPMAPVSAQGHFRLTIEPGKWTAALNIADVVVLFPGVQL